MMRSKSEGFLLLSLTYFTLSSLIKRGSDLDLIEHLGAISDLHFNSTIIKTTMFFWKTTLIYVLKTIYNFLKQMVRIPLQNRRYKGQELAVKTTDQVGTKSLFVIRIFFNGKIELSPF